MYRHLKGGVGIPSFKWFGMEGEYRFMVTELLGPSLEDLRKRCGGSFSLKTVLMIADQVIDTFRYIQSKGVIHRDINPENLLMGLGNNVNKVYVIDFGLAKFYSDPICDEHIPYREDAGFVGTHCFASLYTHLGIEQSRRDDGESLCFVLMYLLKGSLPWQGQSLGSNDEENIVTICNLKFQHTQPEELLHEYPPEFEACLGFARYVCFYSTPAFLSMKSDFRKLFRRKGYDLDHVYDWTTFPEDKPEHNRLSCNYYFSSDDDSRNMIADDVSSSKDVRNNPKKLRRKNRQKRLVTRHSLKSCKIDQDRQILQSHVWRNMDFAFHLTDGRSFTRTKNPISPMVDHRWRNMDFAFRSPSDFTFLMRGYTNLVVHLPEQQN